jgi:hypothetical protein
MVKLCPLTGFEGSELDGLQDEGLSPVAIDYLGWRWVLVRA